MSDNENTGTLFSQLQGLEMLLDVNKILDEKAHSCGITFTTMDPELRVKGGLSTGIYSFDLILGGGYAPGRFSYLYGDTGSGKSTTLYHGIRESLSRQMLTMFHDHESSTDPTYLRNIGVDLDDVCGFRNKKGIWEKTPKLRYSIGTVAEETFKFMNSTMKILPDKVQLYDNKAEEYRYFLVNPQFECKSITWATINRGLKTVVDKRPMVVEVADFSPQMVFVIDSLKSMLPQMRDDDNDSDPIAILARCFSSAFPLVKSYLGRKNCILLATNHMTINPMARFANPESEPGGKAVQFYPDTKMKLHMNRAKNKIVEEKHISGEGLDRYFVGTATVIKNKSGPCFRSIDFRMWLDEQGNPGRGIDPVWDVYTFLDAVGLLVQPTKTSYGINLKGWESESFTWPQFKTLILERPEGLKLKVEIEKLLSDGKAQEMYYANLSAKKSKEAKAEATADDENVETIEI